MKTHPAKPRVAIACGGTGGHIFPGLAVATQLLQRGCAVTLLVSPKDIDQQAVKGVTGVDIAVLPAVGLSRGGRIGFLRGFLRSFRRAREIFRAQPPHAVLAMGGFTAAPPVFAARLAGLPAFLHESNTIPGRANRLLARFVTRAFVGFPQTEKSLAAKNVSVTGTPVRPEFQPQPAEVSRRELGFQPDRPVVLVMGGSQGASGINNLVLAALPLLTKQLPELQWLHLTGANDFERVRQAHAAQGSVHHAVVLPFSPRMDLALNAATVAVSRAGASSLAELAALRVPALVVPYPAATDNHQWHNARAFEATGAAVLLEQKTATADRFATQITQLLQDPVRRAQMVSALAGWHKPEAAGQIADEILNAVAARLGRNTVPNPGAASIPETLMVTLDGRERPWSGFKVVPASAGFASVTLRQSLSGPRCVLPAGVAVAVKIPAAEWLATADTLPA